MIDPPNAPPRSDRPPGIDPANPTTYQRLVYAAVMGLSDDVVVEAARPDLTIVRTRDSKRGMLVLSLAGRDPAALAQKLPTMLARWSVRDVSLVVVGRERMGAELLEPVRKPLPRTKLTLIGVDLDGAPWTEVPDGPVAEALAGGGAAALDWGAFEARLESSRAAFAEQIEFAKRLHVRRPLVTYALVAVNVAFFVLQSWLGGSVDPTVPLLVRMGGVSGELVAQGEVWRLISCAFLHGGVMHLAFNMIVLVVIGRLVERIIGPLRFVVLYTACAVAGSAASAVLMDAPVSVGASGALWGVLAAEAVLAFAPGFLPAAIVPGARRAALINLGINVLNSFRPHVDWAAHFAGGVMGAALLWLVLARGVPRGEERARREPTRSRPLAVAAALCVALLGAGAVAGPILGDALAWREASPTYERVTIERLGASVELPTSRGEATWVGGDVMFGDPRRDRLVVGLARLPSVTPEEVLQTPPMPGATSVDAPVFGDRRGRELGTSRQRLPNGLLVDRAAFAADGGAVLVEVYFLPAQAGYAEGVAASIASSWTAPGGR